MFLILKEQMDIKTLYEFGKMVAVSFSDPNTQQRMIFCREDVDINLNTSLCDFDIENNLVSYNFETIFREHICSVPDAYSVFMRAYVDSNGFIKYKSGIVSLMIQTNSRMKDVIIKYFDNYSLTFETQETNFILTGIDALDALGSFYIPSNKDLPLTPNYKTFVKLANFFMEDDYQCIPHFKWTKNLPDAVAPSKVRFSDSGFDLHLIKFLKKKGDVYYYDTGISVEPVNGYYFDLVGRSSISKTGWTIANNIGIIDSSYRGNIIVALFKHDPDAKEIELPSRMVQLIPRKSVLMEAVEVSTLQKSSRAEGGFGSTN